MLIATKGYAAPEVERVYLRAQDLCQQIGETPQLFAALWGLSACYVTQAKFPLAHELGRQFLNVAQRQQELVSSLEAYRQLGFTLVWSGEFAQARTYLEQGIATYHPQHHKALVSRYGEDPGICCLSFVSQALWALGYPDQASKRIQEALVLARELSHPYSLTLTLLWVAFLHLFRREARAAQDRAQEAVTLAVEHGFPLYEALGIILQGGAMEGQGRHEEGIRHLHQGLASWQSLGAGIIQPYSLSLLAEAYGNTGQSEEGLKILAKALAFIAETGERQSEAELWRLQGELTLQKFNVQGATFNVDNPQSAIRLPPPSGGNPQLEAKACFLKAIEISRKQQAKSLELRAVMSLVRLRQLQLRQHEARAKLDEAHQMLSEVYNWFTEGSDTKDLQEAKALLAELAE